ncbi:MAG: hypothetical protein ABL857_03385 [Rickettsiales bacterium]|jgi:hypothetical protein
MDNNSQDTSLQTEQKNKENIASKALVAGSFGFVGMKIGTIGSIMDADKILKKENLTFGQKLGSVFNGKLWNSLVNEADIIMKTENIGKFKAYSKTMKYGIITTAAGAAALGAIGWVRGGLIDNWKDIIHKPLESTKIVFGMKKPDNQIDELKIASTAPNNITITPKNSEQNQAVNWQSYTKEREQNSASSGKTV